MRLSSLERRLSSHEARLRNVMRGGNLLLSGTVILLHELISVSKFSFISGSTGKPKGVLHTIGGYMLYTAATFK